MVRAVIEARTMTMSCSCGEEGRTFLCPHAERLLDGDASIILSRNVAEIDELIETAWSLEFGRWLAIRREYCGRVDSARAHLATASQWRAKVRMPRPAPLLLEHLPPFGDPQGRTADRPARSTAPAAAIRPSLARSPPAARRAAPTRPRSAPAAGTAVRPPPPPSPRKSARPAPDVPPFVRKGAPVPAAALLAIEEMTPASRSPAAPPTPTLTADIAALAGAESQLTPPPRKVDPKGVPYRVWQPSLR
ncbi:MAG: hypothetical protein AcusKO_46900 [Acuticoccus sp.]